MKKAFFLILCVIALCSCMPSQSNQQVVKQPPIVCLVDSFVATHPNFMNNSITREKANEDWKKAVLDSLKNPHFLDGINLTMVRINKTKKHGYIAQFRSAYNNYDCYKNIRELYFDVLSYVPDSVALNLVEKAEYTISGEILYPITFQKMQQIYEAPLDRYTDDYSITKYEYQEGKYDIKLANIMMDIKELKRK
jgi:hypothetical protein